MNKLYIISRIHTPFIEGMLKGEFFHVGSPAYFNFIKYIDLQKNKFDYEIIFIENRENTHILTHSEYKLKNLNEPIQIIHYKKVFKNNLKLIKLEIILNKIFQYSYLFLKLKNKSIYYIDRENIPLGILLSKKGGLVCYRLLGITKNIYNILFNRKGIVSFIYNKALKLKSSVIISSNDGSWAEPTKRFLNNNNFYLMFNGTNLKTEEYTINKSAILKIVYISRLEKGKGHIEFLELMKLLKDKKINFKATIVGEGSLKKELIDESKDLKDYIVFTGSVEHSEVNEYLKEADLFVSFNYYGIFGNNVIEATSKGLPIIALDNENVSQKYKKYFYITKEKDFENTVQFIMEFYNNIEIRKKYSKMSEEFFDKYIFSWDERIKKELDLISNEFDEKITSVQ